MKRFLWTVVALVVIVFLETLPNSHSQEEVLSPASLGTSPANSNSFSHSSGFRQCQLPDKRGM